MTTKFSQRGGTQTLPPVCRSTVVLLPTFELPPYPPMVAYLTFAIRDAGDVLQSGTRHAKLKWYHPPDLWLYSRHIPPWTIELRIEPFPPPQKTRIDIAISLPFVGAHQFPRHGPAYTPGQPWTSGEKYAPHWDPGEYCWSLFTTLP